jgi:hypothetical protein
VSRRELLVLLRVDFRLIDYAMLDPGGQAGLLRIANSSRLDSGAPRARRGDDPTMTEAGRNGTEARNTLA